MPVCVLCASCLFRTKAGCSLWRSERCYPTAANHKQALRSQKGTGGRGGGRAAERAAWEVGVEEQLFYWTSSADQINDKRGRGRGSE